MESRETDELLTRIYTLLYALGARANLCGFRYAAYAILLSMQDPERLRRPSERLYPEIARRYHTEPQDALRHMRRTIFLIWKENPQRLEELAGEPLRASPPPKRFLTWVCRYLEKGKR